MTQNLIDKYKLLLEIMNGWIKPIIQAHYRRDAQAAQAALATAYADAGQAGLDEDELATVHLNLLVIDFQSIRQMDSDFWQRPVFEELRDKLQQPQPGPLSESVRHAKLLILHVVAERDGLIDYAPELFDQHYQGIHPRLLSREIYHHIGSWGFKHNRPEILMQALERLTESGGRAWSMPGSRKRLSARKKYSSTPTRAWSNRRASPASRRNPARGGVHPIATRESARLRPARSR